jgi:hypothetical protein
MSDGVKGGNAMDRWIRVLVTTAVVLVTFSMEVQAADAPYISGGTGADERAELLAKEKEYNLKIIGAAKSGDFLAGVKVMIESAKKERVLDTTMDGPILLAKLAPGTYIIRATSGSQTLTQTVTIAGQGLRQVNFRWDIPK